MRTQSQETPEPVRKHCGYLRGTIGAVPAKNLIPRGVRIPIPSGHWWPAAARAAANKRADDMEIRRPGLRNLAAELCAQGLDVDEDTIGRCIRGEIVTWDVAVPLSKLLNIPPPAQVSRTQAEAEAMEDADAVRVLLDKLRRVDRGR